MVSEEISTSTDRRKEGPSVNTSSAWWLGDNHQQFAGYTATSRPFNLNGQPTRHCLHEHPLYKFSWQRHG